MDTHKIATKRPGESLKLHDFKGTYRSDVLPLICGNDDHTFLQYVPLRQTGDRCLAFACDEEGLIKQLPPNFQMLTQVGNHNFYESIVGNVVFMVYRLENAWEKEIWDYKLEDLNDEDIKLIEQLLNRNTQERCRRIAEIDPSIEKEPKIFFESVGNLEKLLQASPLTLSPIPSYVLPLFLIGKHFGKKMQIDFYTDENGSAKHTTGMRVKKGTTVEVFCESKMEARCFTIKQDNKVGGLTEDEAIDVSKRYLKILFDWGLPPVVYLEREELRKFIGK